MDKMKHVIRIGRAGLLLLFLLLLTTGCAATASGDRVIFGDNVTIPKDEVVEGDLVVFGGNVVVEEEATIRGDISIFWGSVELNGTVEGDLVVFGGNIVRASDAVRGESMVLGGSEHHPDGPPPPPVPPVAEMPALPDAPEMHGAITRVGNPTMTDRVLAALGTLFGTLLKMVAFGMLGMILALFLPDHVRRVGETAGNAPFASAAVGCLSLPLMALLFGILLVTIVGIPIAALLPLAFAAAGIFGWIGVGFLLGDRLLRSADVRSPRPAAATAIGAGSLALASSIFGVIPFLGWLVGPMVWTWGLGATILTRGGTRRYPGYRRLSQQTTAAIDPLDEIKPTPRSSAPTGNLFADLAADLGIGEAGDEKKGPGTPEKPVPPPSDE